MNSRVKFSAADFVALLCAIAIGVAFLIMPWLSALGTGMTGVKLLSESQAVIGNGVSSLWLILLAAAVGGLAALWGLLDESARRMTGIATCLAGVVGLIYYGIFIVQNNQSPVELTGSVGVGFWVGLLAVWSGRARVCALVIQRLSASALQRRLLWLWAQAEWLARRSVWA